ncbi:unnamed protein product [Lasius platythorax]|uniref:Uncharacterized protein n=1 Tax=Lasius platythorax TaxID=488582 RepID=A0AAV2NBS0_9HYME
MATVTRNCTSRSCRVTWRLR